jgi:hypothetical protein
MAIYRYGARRDWASSPLICGQMTMLFQVQFQATPRQMPMVLEM